MLISSDSDTLTPTSATVFVLPPPLLPPPGLLLKLLQLLLGQDRTPCPLHAPCPPAPTPAKTSHPPPLTLSYPLLTSAPFWTSSPIVPQASSRIRFFFSSFLFTLIISQHRKAASSGVDRRPVLLHISKPSLRRSHLHTRPLLK